MTKNVNNILFSISILIGISGCGGSGSENGTNNPPTTPEEAANTLEEQIKNIGGLSNAIELPPEPEKTIARASIQGVDSNNDGTRDDLEHVAYQGLNTIEGISVSTHNQILSIMNMIQPKEPPKENSINEHDIYCAYKQLPDNAKQELPLNVLYSIVLDTQDRKTAFSNSLQATTTSLGAESCE